MPGRRLALLLALTAGSTAGGFSADTSPADRNPVRAESLPADTGVRTESSPLPFFYDLYTFRGSGDSTTIVAAYAVRAGDLEAEDARSGARYRFSVSLVLADPADRSVSNTHDTVFVDVNRPLPGDHLLYTHVEVLAEPSTTTRQRVIMIDATTPGRGQLYTDAFPIPDYTGTHLMLSDIALGQPDTRSGWSRGGVTLALLPTSQFPTSAFNVYYEIYNLPAGARYTTEIGVAQVDPSDTTRDDEDDAPPVRLYFTGESAADDDGTLSELRLVQGSLARGSYRITVVITNQETGETVSRSRHFDVRGWERGATMVAALPHPSEEGSPHR
ncbi:MAG: hypothetical protein ACREKM_11910 [Longimicrobiales bacterium]